MRQHLFIDADDTLWENNVYFEDAFDRFVDFLDHSSMTPVQIRAALDEIEIVNAQIHGYGSLNFGRNLQQCYQHLAQRDIHEGDLARVMSFAEQILDSPMELIDGVETTLASLAERHVLVLCTKGNPDEQKMKIDRSGLARYFVHTRIVKEKHSAVYGSLTAELDCDLDRTWMIGNSPKSDINPALAAGLGAVFIPHERTWGLEKEHVLPSPRLLVIDRFSDLTRHF